MSLYLNLVSQFFVTISVISVIINEVLKNTVINTISMPEMYKYLLNSVMLCVDMLHSVDSQTFVQMIEHGSEQTPNYAHKYKNEEINGSP